MTATPDPHAPRWHVRAPHGWLNDPNGIGRWDGRWHVMYQWNPHAPVWGDIHWGHASSPDLLRWDHEPVALAPRPGTLDGGGTWSGVAVHDGGDVALVYSAVRDTAASAGVAVARRGPDGAWVQPDRLAAPHPQVAGVSEVRDPFVLTVDGRRLGIQGAGTPAGGAVIVYDVADLDDWRPLGTLLAADAVPEGVDAPGQVWECPQLVRVGDAWVLLVSWFDRTVAPERLGVTAYTGRLDLAGEGPPVRRRGLGAVRPRARPVRAAGAGGGRRTGAGVGLVLGGTRPGRARAPGSGGRGRRLGGCPVVPPGARAGA